MVSVEFAAKASNNHVTSAHPLLKPNADSLSDSDVPSRLIAAATKLYGDHGCHAVSARQIIKHAGVLNDAAIRYYFGGKHDLLRACLHAIAAEFQPVFASGQAELAARKLAADKPPITARHVITALFKSFVSCYQQNSAALKLMARLMREEGEEGQRLQTEELGDILWWLENQLTEVLPGKSPKAIRLHSTLAITVIINGLVDQQLISTLPAAAAGRPDYPLDIDELGQGFIEFLTVGVAGPSAI